jgi:hypothetical protein
MSFNYNQYGTDRPNRSANSFDDVTLKIEANTTIEGTLTEVFGTENQRGQSLAVKFEDAVVLDGCLYRDTEYDDRYKLFSWQEVMGRDPSPDFIPSPDDCNQYLMKNYMGNEKTYEFVGARRQAVETEPDFDDDLLERAQDGDAGAQQAFAEAWENFTPEVVAEAEPVEPVPIAEGKTVMWYGGSQRFGPKSASKTLAQTLTEPGRNMVIRNADGEVSDNVNSWITDTTKENIVREDLEGRRFAFFEVNRKSNTSGNWFKHPYVVDVQTDETVLPRREDEQAELSQPASTDGGAVTETQDQDQDDVPEPVADFITHATKLGFGPGDEAEAAAFLNDLLVEPNSGLTQEMVDDYGGEDAVIAAALQG